ncbi:nucleotide pyrophosphohydrolase [Sulfobacillus thermosulfidooxidans]|uniref:Nucleotide pyrophosphohydrolase n=1 Tax=Sulfobacillus thermosulfidooxidans TaxID=28034 RepID=A0A1R0IK64_SULTH|nr:nucleotide pyrophosphohydrolase [Sulfobacillus thermosulfidooxidans]OLZ11143.1 nucleotide pyrophosphohydrolase [Sulfobacillus thermosulfidooxidans]OLZ14126.1 nucleotide pyrophosphohydrolase [Sulfobacillus thermosulfidooxidans]OLZ18870.1 nucleotide pyrophosphohydrolase [Sulfobacillus thermosulfidooxidans]PSR26666.1 MAG: nucleotide pyrophosphohydrolase [Sulfobacillus thermosulfidooxidans]
MTIQEMQQQVDAWISQFEEGYFAPSTMILRLAEELGELAREVNHVYGEKPKKPTEPDGSIAMELGDMLFVLVSFANSLHLDLTDVFQAVMTKFQTRDQNRWTKKSSESLDSSHSDVQKGG